MSSSHFIPNNGFLTRQGCFLHLSISCPIVGFIAALDFYTIFQGSRHDDAGEKRPLKTCEGEEPPQPWATFMVVPNHPCTTV